MKIESIIGDPVVFLDMDGVICTRRAAGWSRQGKPLTLLPKRRPVRAIDAGCINLLNRLCATTGAAVVVSSTWRIDKDVPAILRYCGFTGGLHPDWRTDQDGPDRRHEIERWLAAHHHPRFVILDDKPVALDIQRQVMPDNYCGITDRDVALATEILAHTHALGVTAEISHR